MSRSEENVHSLGGDMAPKSRWSALKRMTAVASPVLRSDQTGIHGGDDVGEHSHDAGMWDNVSGLETSRRPSFPSHASPHPPKERRLLLARDCTRATALSSLTFALGPCHGENRLASRLKPVRPIAPICSTILVQATASDFGGRQSTHLWQSEYQCERRQQRSHIPLAGIEQGGAK